MENTYENWILEVWDNPMTDEKEVWLSSLLLNDENLTIKFESEDAIYDFKFRSDSPVRIIDEAFRLGLWEVMKKQGILGSGTTWMVQNSNFITDLDNDGAWCHFNPHGKHYLFLTPNEVIDVLSGLPPVISKRKIESVNE